MTELIKKEEHYTSLEEMAAAWRIKPVKKQTSDKKKLAEQREIFCKHHKCKSCGENMEYTPYNMMVCKNEKCKGIKIEKEDKDGNKIISYVPSFELLDAHWSEVAMNLFS